MTTPINPPSTSQLAGLSLPPGLLASMAWMRYMQGWARPTHGLRRGGLHLATMACLRNVMARQRTLQSMIVGRADGAWTVLTLNWQAVVVQQTRRSARGAVALPATNFREIAVPSPRWKPTSRTPEPDNQAATPTAAGLPAAHRGVGLATSVPPSGLAAKIDRPLHRPTSISVPQAISVLQAAPPLKQRAVGQVPSGVKWSPEQLGMQMRPDPAPALISGEVGRRLPTTLLAAQPAIALEQRSQRLAPAGQSLPTVRQEWPAMVLAGSASNMTDMAGAASVINAAVINAATKANDAPSLGDLLFDQATRARGDIPPSDIWQQSPSAAKARPDRVQQTQTSAIPHIDRDGMEQIATRVMRIIKREQRREREIKGRI
ncbi:hypothetical protein ACO0K9_03415 [Undibacterium sp. Ji50W]|uniref:hypothetical protein n=1 Tax=Undibacterium sp. Ji50W TaxID=3413041 RepID=UPI003BF24F21